MTEPYKLKELTAAEAAALKQSRYQIKYAREALYDAEATDRALINKIFGDLIGKLVEYRALQVSWRHASRHSMKTYRVRIDRATAYQEALSFFEGYVVLKNGSVGSTRKRIYARDIENGRVTVLGDA